MKLSNPLLIISILACVLANYISASPTELFHRVARGLSEWGIGHYGGTVSEISKQEALELEKSIVPLPAASRTISNISCASMTTTEITESSSNEGSPTTWSSTYTTTTTVTVTITVIPTARNFAKREEILSLDNEGSLLEGDAVVELNRSLRMYALALGDPCTLVAGEERVDSKICVGGAVAICGEKSLIWESYTDCRGSGLVCGAIEARGGVNGDSKADIQCLEMWVFPLDRLLYVRTETK
ncbi:uncharacterized protein LAJ45_02414 [Morchella importuna]|uniref:uncharacterized protein n=1 Tax=Morchella importuna TaxID=1174673 RepID=UPI001E8D8E2F|nr:uncharacterized protein LAJ45_02414 [Morchella importuna]KAH8153601.1 hypothetical protein LAJ45_02414 [Morchella importuna]